MQAMVPGEGRGACCRKRKKCGSPIGLECVALLLGNTEHPKSELSAPLPEEAQELGLRSLSHTQAVVLTRDSLSYLGLLTGPLEGLFVGTCWRKGHGENYCRHFGATFLLITWDFFIVFSPRNPMFPS